MNTSTSSNKQLAALQGLRAYASFLVILGHCAVKGATNMGGWAVSIFFILSGFVLTYSHSSKYLSNTIKDSIIFSVNKIKKLYPLHLILLISMIVLEAFENNHPVPNFVALFFNTSLLQAWFYEPFILNSFNGITWYLSASMFLYALFPTIKKIIDKYTNTKQPIIIIISTYMLALLWSYMGNKFLSDSICGWFQYFFPITRTFEFIIGCNLGYIFLKRNHTKKSYVFSSVLECISLLFSFLSWKFMSNNILNLINIDKHTVIIPSIIILIYLLACSNGIISKLFSLYPIVQYGNISPYTYMIHYPVLRYIYFILYYLNLQNISPIIVAIADFTLTLICSILFLNLQKLIPAKQSK